MKTIFVMVKCELGKAYEVADAAVGEIEQVSEVYSTSGQFDLLMKCSLSDATDIGHFVKYFGYTPAEALRCATAIGGARMQHEGDLGNIKVGALADLLLVDGNPLKDLALLGDQGKHLSLIMKAGILHKNRLN